MKKKALIIVLSLTLSTFSGAFCASAAANSFNISDSLATANAGSQASSIGKLPSTGKGQTFGNVNDALKQAEEKAKAESEAAEAELAALEAETETEAAVEVETEVVEPETEVAEVETEAVEPETEMIEEVTEVETEIETEAITEEIVEETEVILEEAEEMIPSTDPAELAEMYAEILDVYKTDYNFEELIPYDISFVDLDNDNVEELILREAYSQDDFTTLGQFYIYKHFEDGTVEQVGSLSVPTYDLYMSKETGKLAQTWTINPSFIYYYSMVDGSLANVATLTYGDYAGPDGTGKRIIERSEKNLCGEFKATLFSATSADESWNDADLIWSSYEADLAPVDFTPLLVFLTSVTFGA